MIKKRGQVWIEAVTYTLIAFVMIGLILSFAKPKIQQLEDHATLEQSMKMIRGIDSVVQEVGGEGIGNKRKVELTLKEGNLEINGINNSIIFTMKSKYLYSQPNQTYEEGNVKVTTMKKGQYYNIHMERDYNFNLTYNGKKQNKKITHATTPYTLFITNNGGTSQVIDFDFE